MPNKNMTTKKKEKKDQQQQQHFFNVAKYQTLSWCGGKIKINEDLSIQNAKIFGRALKNIMLEGIKY